MNPPCDWIFFLPPPLLFSPDDPLPYKLEIWLQASPDAASVRLSAARTTKRGLRIFVRMVALHSPPPFLIHSAFLQAELSAVSEFWTPSMLPGCVATVKRPQWCHSLNKASGDGAPPHLTYPCCYVHLCVSVPVKWAGENRPPPVILETPASVFQLLMSCLAAACTAFWTHRCIQPLTGAGATCSMEMHVCRRNLKRGGRCEVAFKCFLSWQKRRLFILKVFYLHPFLTFFLHLTVSIVLRQ